MFTTDMLIAKLNEKNILDRFWIGNYGIEKENLRVLDSGEIAKSNHPSIFGDKLENPYITTDFGEQQLELITPVMNRLEDTYDYLKSIEKAVYEEIGDEYLWPQSSPCNLPKEEEIEIAVYNKDEKGVEARSYREKLAKFYGKKKQLLSGIHYNFSFDEEIIKLMYEDSEKKITYKDFKNNLYLKISRRFFKYRWLLIYLYGASPSVHSSYNNVCLGKMEKISDDAYTFNSSTSFRNGKCGYKNRVEEFVPYDTLDNYITTLENMIRNKKIQNEKEYYSPLRLKSKDGTLKMLKEEGIEYLEIRLFDLNPLVPLGIDLNTLYFLQGFLYFILNKTEDNYTKENLDRDNKNHYISSCTGLNNTNSLKLTLLKKDGVESFKDKGLLFIKEMKEYFDNNKLSNIYLKNSFEYAIEAFLDSNNTIASKIKKGIVKNGYVNYFMNIAKENKLLALSKSYNFEPFTDLELSTQILIKESIKRGVKVEVIDRKANFIRLSKNCKIEYIKQATKTSLDSYITFLTMENKLVSKKVLDENKIRTPKGYSFSSKEEALGKYHFLDKKALVIKPNNTNFGTGISIFKTFPNYEKYKEAVEIAFNNDHTILIEEFVKGKEYRFLVMGSEVVGILHRVPANVLGNGKDTIRELVNLKNQDSLRGKGYISPLEIIKLGRIEEVFLEGQNFNFDTVLKKNQLAYLRENSNISTGGDSLDYTDLIHDSYKKIAIASSKAVGAKICGVDLMIDDINKPLNSKNYAIIEVNFNPAIHIHTYPYKGKNRKPAGKLLNLLGF